MMSYEEALNKLLSNTPNLNEQEIDLKNALGCISSQFLRSREVLPAFANAAMDGYAIQSETTLNCSKLNPLTLPVVGTVFPGFDACNTRENSAYEIMTGAKIPLHYDAVIALEKVSSVDPKNLNIVLNEPVRPGLNIRNPGEDFQLGNIILKPGNLIQPEHIMALASLGEGKITIFDQLRVSVFSTGNELVPYDTMKLAEGQIRQSNGIYLTCALRNLGVKAAFKGILKDNLNSIEAQIKKCLDRDHPHIILTTGAVSAGKHDYIPHIVHKLRGEILFHKIAMRPGKPILASKISETTLFGLPGNPIACMIGFRFIIYPLIRKMRGMAAENCMKAKLKREYTKKIGLKTFCKGWLETDHRGQMTVEILNDQESFKIKPLLHANCWAILEGYKNEYAAHEIIDCVPLHPLEGTKQ